VRSSVNRIALGTIIGEQPWREMLAADKAKVIDLPPILRARIDLHYRNVRQSDPQIQHSQLDNWAADLRHRLPTAERFSASKRYGKSLAETSSLRFDVGRPDHLAPLLCFFADELAEVGGRARKRRRT
jgi:hypothetical protein